MGTKFYLRDRDSSSGWCDALKQFLNGEPDISVDDNYLSESEVSENSDLKIIFLHSGKESRTKWKRLVSENSNLSLILVASNGQTPKEWEYKNQRIYACFWNPTQIGSNKPRIEIKKLQHALQVNEPDWWRWLQPAENTNDFHQKLYFMVMQFNSGSCVKPVDVSQTALEEMTNLFADNENIKSILKGIELREGYLLETDESDAKELLAALGMLQPPSLPG